MWRQFCSKLNSKTQTQKVWKAIKKIKGNGSLNSVNHLKVNSKLITNKKEVVEALAINLSKYSLTDNRSSKFQRIKMLKKDVWISLLETKTELKESLQRANDSATGLDQVCYKLLTHLPNSALSVLLKENNHTWESSCFPPLWCVAVVILIPKSSKDHLDPSNFRPIALTSCLCKMMERMINTHLIWSLKSQGLSEDHKGLYQD